MRPGVYIGKADHGNYDLVSTGDYVNPVSTTFKLKNTQRTLALIHDLYLIIYDIEVEYIKIEISGQMTFIRCYLSWDGDDWFKRLEIHETIDAVGDTEIRPFKLKVVCDDFLDYYSLTGETIFKNYKLRLVYI